MDAEFGRKQARLSAGRVIGAGKHAARQPGDGAPSPDARSVDVPVVAGLVRELAGHSLQRQLAVGAADDSCEHEADAVARDIVKALRGRSERAINTDPIAGVAPPEADGTLPVRPVALRKRGNPAGQPTGDAGEQIGAAGGELQATQEQAIRRARGGGSPLDETAKSRIEPLLGADLSAVRLHSGPEAAALNEGMQARAFTVGSDIFFRDGIPSADDDTGLRLLAHELTHTVQQGAVPAAVSRALAAPTSVQRDGTTTAPTSPPSAPAPSGPSKEDVEKALDLFAKRDGKKITAAVNAYASKQKEAEERDLGKGFTGSGKVEASVQAGAFGGAEIRELQDAYAILIEAGAVIGASIKLEGELKRKFGKVEAKLKGSLSAFVGAMVKAFGKVEIGKTGISAEGSAKGFAGAESVQNASLEMGVGDYGAKVEAEAREMAGAEFDAEGTFALKKGEIALGGQFSAFAGAKVEGKVKTSGTLYGREAASLEVTGTAEAGAGVTGSGHFSIKRGVLRVKLGGSLAAGLGGGGGAHLVTDFKPIGVWIIRKAYKTWWANNEDQAKDVLDNPAGVKQDLIDDLAEYGAFKRKQLSLGSADNYVKEEKIQQYVNKHVPRAMVKGHSNAAAVDAMIKGAVEEAFTEGGVKTVEVAVKDGKVKVTKSTPPTEYSKAKNVVTSEKTGRGLGSVTKSSKG